MEYFSHATLILGENRAENYIMARKAANRFLGLSEDDQRVHADLCITGDEKNDYAIANIRDIRQKAFLSPVAASCKVYILKNLEDMPVQSQNALLKIIEEPPEGVYFIFTSTSIGPILPTVLSRVTIIKNDIDTEFIITDEVKEILDLIDKKKEFLLNCKFSESKAREDFLQLLNDIRIGLLIKRDNDCLKIIDEAIEKTKRNVNIPALITVLSHKLVKEKR